MSPFVGRSYRISEIPTAAILVAGLVWFGIFFAKFTKRYTLANKFVYSISLVHSNILESPLLDFKVKKPVRIYFSFTDPTTLTLGT